MLWPYVTSPGKFPPRVPGPTFRGHCCPAVNRCVFWGIRWWLNLRNEHMLGKWSTWGSPIKVAPYPKEIYITLGLSQGLFNNTQCQEVCMTRFIKRGGWWGLSTEPLLILVSKKSCTLKTQQHASISIASMDLCQVLPRTTGFPSETLSRELGTNLSAHSCSKPFLGKIKNFASPSASPKKVGTSGTFLQLPWFIGENAGSDKQTN